MNPNPVLTLAFSSLDDHPSFLAWYMVQMGEFPVQQAGTLEMGALKKVLEKYYFKKLTAKEYVFPNKPEPVEMKVVAYFHRELKILIHLWEGRACKETELASGEKIKGGSACWSSVFYDGTVKTNPDTEKVMKEIGDCYIKKAKYPSENTISFLCHNNSQGFYLNAVKLNKPEVDLSMNYGKDFPNIHKKLMGFLDSDKTGLILLHGEPGTGKTSYIRRILTEIEKSVIYVPSYMMGRIAEPSLVPFLLEQKDSVLVIEDAEEVITNRRDSNNASGVANLLNLTDGILGESIRIKVLATFNVKKSEIDKALLRKGRLALEHEFKKLSTEDAQVLLKHLKKEQTASEPMTLGEIYNSDYDNGHEEPKSSPLGFRMV